MDHALLHTPGRLGRTTHLTPGRRIAPNVASDMASYGRNENPDRRHGPMAYVPIKRPFFCGPQIPPRIESNFLSKQGSCLGSEQPNGPWVKACVYSRGCLFAKEKRAEHGSFEIHRDPNCFHAPIWCG